MTVRPTTEPVFRIRPLGLGVRTGPISVNAKWPFPAQFCIYRDGLYFRAFEREAFASREMITFLQHTRGIGYVRCEWRAGGDIHSAAVSDWFRISRILAALRTAGYNVAER